MASHPGDAACPAPPLPLTEQTVGETWGNQESTGQKIIQAVWPNGLQVRLQARPGAVGTDFSIALDSCETPLTFCIRHDTIPAQPHMRQRQQARPFMGRLIGAGPARRGEARGNDGVSAHLGRGGDLYRWRPRRQGRGAQWQAIRLSFI